MNGETNTDPNPVAPSPKIESFVIGIVTTTLCLLAMECVTTDVLSVLYKIPDMNTTLSNAFMHITDTVVGALLGWTAKSGAQKILNPNRATTEITNTPDHPVPTAPQPPNP